MLQCYADTLFNVLCSNATTTGGRERVYVHAQDLAKTEEMSKCTKSGWCLARWFPVRFGQNPSRTEAKAYVFTASKSNLACPCGEGRTAIQSYGVTLLQRSSATL